MMKIHSALWHRRILSFFTLIMMGVSWPLWLQGTDVPHFAVVSHPVLQQISPFLLVVCVSGLLLSLHRHLGRIGCSLIVISGLGLILLDQQRIQAWFYQTLVLSLIYALLPDANALGFCRFFAVILYGHSALSKFDHSFAETMGPYLISPVLKILPEELGPNTLFRLVFGLPVGELIATLILALGWFRIGCAAIVFMHSSLILVLGPWALDHSANVLLWNVSMAIQAIILFGLTTPIKTPETSIQKSEPPDTMPSPIGLGIVQLVLMAVAILPFFERAGLWDPWPSFALYAGHVEQLRIEFPVADGSSIPSEFQPYVNGTSGSYVLDLTAWSRMTLGSPPYPAARIHRNLARYIAGRCPADLPMTAIMLGKAHWRTGRRDQRVLSGQAMILNIR
ncbi:MAG: hypothetical protein RJA81_1310 [Planctomycetota bacterium]